MRSHRKRRNPRMASWDMRLKARGPEMARWGKVGKDKRAGIRWRNKEEDRTLDHSIKTIAISR